MVPDSWLHNRTTYQSVKRVGESGDVPEVVYGLLSALLLCSENMGSDIAAVLEEQAMALPDRPFRVVLFSLDDEKLQEISGAARHNCRVWLYDAIRTDLLRRLDGGCAGFLFLLSGYLLGILYPETADVTAACREAIQFAGETLDVSVHGNISTQWTGVENIERAYRTVSDVENSRSFYTGMMDRFFVIPDNALLRIVDRDQMTEFEQTFFQTSNRVCGSLRAEEPEMAAVYIGDQLRKIAENCIGMPYPMSLALTVNRFLSVLQYTLSLEDLADWRYLSSRDFSRDLVSSPDLESFVSAADTIAAELTEHVRQRRFDRHDKLMRDMRRYLEENASDMNIGLTSIARDFHVTPREAAESFRNYYGISVNDVIHEARVKKAKELILTTNESIQNIAKEVGYCSLATMYRAFTNIEGVAPGKLRQNRDNQTGS